MDAISSATSGIHDGLRRYERASRDLVESVSRVSNASPERAVVDMITAEQQVKANSATVRAAQQMYGALLDVLV